jgi:hypothetical protein
MSSTIVSIDPTEDGTHNIGKRWTDKYIFVDVLHLVDESHANMSKDANVRFQAAAAACQQSVSSMIAACDRCFLGR